MKESIRHKLESVRDRFEELAGLLADPEVIGDQNKFRELSKEYSRVEPIVKLFSDYESTDADMAAAREMAEDSDAEIREMGEEELATLQERHDALELELQKALTTLPEKQRLVFNMKYFEDLKYDEISEILETSVGGLKASYHLAVKKVEKYLKGETSPVPDPEIKPFK